MKSRRRSYLKLIIALFCAVLLFFGLYFGLKALEKLLVGRYDEEILSGLTADEFGRIEYNGKTYSPRSRLTTTLVIGLDRDALDENEASNSAMADFLALLVFDEKNNQCTVIQINRDTMMEVPVIGVLGDKAGTTYKQIASAHSYGTGRDDSCRNTADAVSSLFYGVHIDNYISVTLEAVPVINDIVGGVSVEIKEDFSSVDDSLVMGETVVLKGEQALTYVRARAGVGDQSNVSRMERQREYMSSFADSLTSAVERDPDVIDELLDATDKYVVTDCTLTERAELCQFVSTYSFDEIIIPKGESKVGKVYMEHFVDEDALIDLVLDIFYEEEK